MLIFLSPALNMRAAQAPVEARQPRFLPETRQLVDELRRRSPWQLESLLRCNSEIALRAFAAYRDFDMDAAGTPAAAGYYGIAYTHLNAASFTAQDYAYADGHLRILSALYGSLRPSDGISPHRLEMQTRLRVEGRDLYGFWGDRLYRDLFERGEPVLSLASGEYERAVSPYLRPRDRMVSARFLVSRRGRWVVLPTEAKMARGEMARHVIQNRIDDLGGVMEFDWNGYRYAPALSDGRIMTFLQER
ncbi:YaaA family protein [Feifania hominis]|uniref:UPF0246 protein H8695_01700 n=1 Tax=Feifania hominis TaxID=2763660 RepID=A0A926DE79_9FIRM|nr:YaaA family protein [Feifania hominis]MBC8535410.1 YaaA family protein [Feifania hominis]